MSEDKTRPQPSSNSCDPEPGKRSNYRWVVISLAFAITLVNYLDRSAIAYAIKPLKAEFHLNNAQFGDIAGAFGIGYMVMTVGGGVLVDRFGARWVWSIAAFLWSACTASMGIVGGYGGLFALRAVLGLAEGPHFPSLTRVVSDWLPTHERARATAYGLTAVPAASVIGAPLISNLVIYFGWQTMFVILGLLGMLWSFVWIACYRDYPEHSARVSDEELAIIREGKASNRTDEAEQIKSEHIDAGKTSWRFMLFNPSLLANNFAFFAFGYLLFFALTWLPGYFEQTYGLELKQLRIYLIAPWLTAAILLPLAGWLSDWLYHKSGSMRVARSQLIWICQLISVLCFVPLMFTHSLNLTLVMISLGVGFGLMPNAAFYALNWDLARDRAGTSVGIMDCFFALAGILAPVLTGRVAQATGAFTGAFALLIGFGLCAVLAVLIFQKPDRLDLQ